MIHDFAYSVVLDRFVCIRDAFFKVLYAVGSPKVFRSDVLHLFESLSTKLSQEADTSFFWDHSCRLFPDLDLSEVDASVGLMSIPLRNVTIFVLLSKAFSTVVTSLVCLLLLLEVWRAKAFPNLGIGKIAPEISRASG